MEFWLLFTWGYITSAGTVACLCLLRTDMLECYQKGKLVENPSIKIYEWIMLLLFWWLFLVIIICVEIKEKFLKTRLLLKKIKYIIDNYDKQCPAQ